MNLHSNASTVEPHFPLVSPDTLTWILCITHWFVGSKRRGKTMASTFKAENLGFIHLVNPKLPYRTQCATGSRFAGSNTIRFVSGRISGRQDLRLIAAHTHIKCAASSGRNQLELSFSEDDNRSEAFWSSLIKEAFWGLRSLLVFLVEQPGQLKYIEWPSFQSTDVQMREEPLAESLRKRGELSSDMNEEGMLVVAIEPPAQAVRKRHHTLTRNHSIPPLFKRAPLPPLPSQNSTIFQMLQQCDEYEPGQDIQY
ncbi:uncharacterized protein LOC122062748 [Macadamia integrifolia]|uniref:uncharacterized protein LOC122062748 n=1 Tax=Macadamia integrifolia TaxID=60698 RepID=UPI001C50131F|nr:uncharacterized protein LOC122062748 [Macadamia integrifolia]